MKAGEGCGEGGNYQEKWVERWDRLKTQYSEALCMRTSQWSCVSYLPPLWGIARTKNGLWMKVFILAYSSRRRVHNMRKRERVNVTLSHGRREREEGGGQVQQPERSPTDCKLLRSGLAESWCKPVQPMWLLSVSSAGSANDKWRFWINECPMGQPLTKPFSFQGPWQQELNVNWH